jgi:FMN-binding protein
MSWKNVGRVKVGFTSMRAVYAHIKMDMDPCNSRFHRPICARRVRRDLFHRGTSPAGDFPWGKFHSEQAQAIERRSDANVRNKELHVWKTSSDGFFIVDEVVGKHEFITYAIGLNADGTVKQIEIMTYRESYGYEVRNPDWRAQFVGKNASAPLKLNKDIKNISGATLSCRHIADGVKRILATYEVALK